MTLATATSVHTLTHLTIDQAPMSAKLGMRLVEKMRIKESLQIDGDKRDYVNVSVRN
jgi:hypothetical protein